MYLQNQGFLPLYLNVLHNGIKEYGTTRTCVYSILTFTIIRIRILHKFIMRKIVIKVLLDNIIMDFVNVNSIH